MATAASIACFIRSPSWLPRKSNPSRSELWRIRLAFGGGPVEVPSEGQRAPRQPSKGRSYSGPLVPAASLGEAAGSTGSASMEPSAPLWPRWRADQRSGTTHETGRHVRSRRVGAARRVGRNDKGRFLVSVASVWSSPAKQRSRWVHGDEQARGGEKGSCHSQASSGGKEGGRIPQAQGCCAEGRGGDPERPEAPLGHSWWVFVVCSLGAEAVMLLATGTVPPR